MPKFYIEGQLTCYFSAEIEAENEDEARLKADYEDVDWSYENDYDSAHITEVKQVDNNDES